MPRANKAIAKDSMPDARRRPTTASRAEVSSRPTGERPSLVSMKWAQKRRPNMIAEVQMKRILPCSAVNRLPVMASIQPSVPSSTAPTKAWVTNSTNRISEPTENFVSTPTEITRMPPTI
jgi:hypothetical protein